LPDTFVSLSRNLDAELYVKSVHAYDAYLSGRADIRYDFKRNRVAYIVKMETMLSMQSADQLTEGILNGIVMEIVVYVLLYLAVENVVPVLWKMLLVLVALAILSRGWQS
jgi:hypothetical protein